VKGGERQADILGGGVGGGVPRKGKRNGKP